MTKDAAFSRNFFLLVFVNLLIFTGAAAADADGKNKEYQPKTVEIQGAPKSKIREKLAVGPVEKIEERKFKMPEVPRRITRKGLNPAEKVRLAASERKKASGKITETEYDLDEDTLARDSNITF